MIVIISAIYTKQQILLITQLIPLVILIRQFMATSTENNKINYHYSYAIKMCRGGSQPNDLFQCYRSSRHGRQGWVSAIVWLAGLIRPQIVDLAGQVRRVGFRQSYGQQGQFGRRVSLFSGMERWNGMVEWNGIVE